MQTNELWLILKCYIKTQHLKIMFNNYKEDLALDNPQELICHKTKPNQTYRIRFSI